MREEIIENICTNKIIAIVRNVPTEKLKQTAEAIIRGGINSLEVTFDATGKTPDEQTAENIAGLVKEFSGAAYIGAGTVLTEKQVFLLKQAGGEFIISPDVRENVIKRTRELDLVSIPGALTPTEIQSAHLYGADFVKLFPISQLGADYAKAIRAPLKHIRMLAVGGVTEQNLSQYLSAGICGFGVGGNIVDLKAIAKNDFALIQSRAEAYVKRIREIES